MRRFGSDRDAFATRVADADEKGEEEERAHVSRSDSRLQRRRDSVRRYILEILVSNAEEGVIHSL